ncbi:MAG: hypothetical protein C0428_02425 [Polaromonas sp.]|nr:hypothetical protein [Polaromonas sp.]
MRQGPRQKCSWRTPEQLGGPVFPQGRPKEKCAPSGLEPAAPKLSVQLWTGDRSEASGKRRPARCSDDTQCGAWGP